MITNITYVILVVGFSLIWSNTYSQTIRQDSINDKILVENADNFISESINDKKVQLLRGNVRVIHDSIFMFSDSSVIKDNILSSIGDVIIIQNDSVTVFADSLHYNGNAKTAELFYNVVLESNEKQLFTDQLLYLTDTKMAYFNDTTTLISQDMTLSSLTAIYDVDQKKARFYKDVTIIDDKMKLRTDSLLYDTDIDRAYFIAPTYIQQEGRKIYCESGYYDIADDRAYFDQNAIITEEDKTASAESIFYDGANDMIYLNKNAYVEDSVSYTQGDQIIFNELTEDVDVIGNALYISEGDTIQGPYIKYNQVLDRIALKGKSIVRNKNGLLEGDTLNYNNITALGEVKGNASWVDSSQTKFIDSDILFYNDSTQFYKAIKDSLRPLYKQLVDNDSLYLSADTLISERIGDTVNTLIAVRTVKIFKSDFQASCDSLFYSEADSTFRLFFNPVAWSDTTQFFADSIEIKLEEDAISEIIASQNAFIISEEDPGFFNQIKGKYVHAFLDSNALKRMHVSGNSESLYFIKDDNEAYIGPNKTLCTEMVFHFDKQELQHIQFLTEPDSKMTPMDKATEAELKLQGFAWRQKERPADYKGLRTWVSSPVVRTRNTVPQDTFGTTVLDVMEKSMQGKRGSSNKENKDR